MTGSAAPGVLLKLEQALAQWQQWQVRLPGAPHLIEALGGGNSNHSFLVEAAGRRFVVRIDRVNPAANGISRQAEWRVLQSAAARGIAPTPRYFNPDLGALVCDYRSADADNTFTPTELAGLLRTLHALPAIHLRMDPVERIRRYLHQLSPRWQMLEALNEPLQEALAHSGPLPQTVCHHDLGRGNLLVSGGQLLALDWEYVAMGSPWFDLAVVVREHTLADRDPEAVLRHYLGRAPDATERHVLQVQDLLSRYLELLWYASGQDGDSAGYPIAARAAELADLLGISPGNC